MSKYYDGTKLLSLTDINGKKPEIYICTSNRSAGKTTYFNRYFVNRFIKTGEKFGLIYRFKYELDDCAEKFFKDINSLFFPEYIMTSKKCSNGIYHRLYLNDKECGYAFALNSADAIKKMSHLFSDVDRLLFDEFQSETNNYCADEVNKFQSLHKSIARGQNKQVKYVPVFMVANPVSLINPYYVNMGITRKLTKNVKFLKGDGYVLEQGYNESANNAQQESGFNRAFMDSTYNQYSSYGVYLNDNLSFIEAPKGAMKYLATIKYNGAEYSLKQYRNEGIIYCDSRVDKTFPFKIAVSTDDHDVNYIMMRDNEFFISTMKYYFERGCFRFKDLNCKEALFALVSVK